MQDVVDAFLKPYNDKKIAVYGTGLNAERVIRTVRGYSFSCIISNDDVMIGRDFYGAKVVTMPEALTISEVILIAAIPSSARIVYERIKKSVPKNIPVFELSGIQMNKPMGYRNFAYWDVRYEDLIKAVDEHEVISFDVFDTLLMRKVLNPQTVLELAENFSNEDSVVEVEGFLKKRVDAENRMYEEGGHPTIFDIYDRIKDNNARLSEWQILALQNLEISLERSLAVRRESVYEAFQYALSERKKIYIVSDMYLTKSLINLMLSDAGISGYIDILVSCEQKCDKGRGELFEKLIEIVDTKDILHIGDNNNADIDGAKRAGIDSFHVLSAKDLMLSSSIYHILGGVGNKWDELILGHILSEIKLFNNTFELGKTRGRIYLDSVEMLTELCVVPITISYVSWMIRRLRGKADSAVLFVSRDGYLLEKIYRNIRTSHPELRLPASVYFYTSRKAMHSVIPVDESGIEYLCGGLNEYRKTEILQHLEKVFGIRLRDDLKQYEGKYFNEIETDLLVENLKGIKGKIFKYASECRDRYQKYIEKLNLEDYGTVYLVDLVSQGSSRYGLSSMCGKEVTMLSLASKADLNVDKKSAEHIKSMFPLVIPGVGGAVGSMFTLLELAYASNEGQLTGFDADGNPQMDDGTKCNGELLERIQGTILSFIDSYADESWFLREYTNSFVENMLGILHPEYSDVSDEVRELFGFYDPLREMSENYNVLNDVRGDIR